MYERDLEHPVPTSALREEEVTAGVPVQLSEAVAVDADGNEVGLQPRSEEAGQNVNTGTSVSTV